MRAARAGKPRGGAVCGDARWCWPRIPSPRRLPRSSRVSCADGASPRAAQALTLGGKIRALLAGRGRVEPCDVARVAVPALRHRIILNYEGEAERIDADALVKTVLEHVQPAA